MIWPKFNTIVAVTGSEQVFQLVLQEKLCKPLKELGFMVSAIESKKDDIIPADGFLYFPSWFNLYVNKEFIENEYDRQSQFYSEFESKLEEIFSIAAQKQDESVKENMRAAKYSLFYKVSDSIILLFQFHNDTGSSLITKFKLAMNFISDLSAGKQPEVKNDISKSYSYNDKIYYVGYLNDFWQIVDPLQYVSDQINAEYRKNADLRAHKPDIVLQEDNLRRRHTFGDNWVLKFDGLSTVIDRPNDVALYSSICEKNLLIAEKFYEDTILIRHQYYSGSMPLPEQQVEYFNYFELITTAIIFSYSSIEAFLNHFIPEDYTFTKPNGTKVMDKKHIERYFSLTDKLKMIFTDLYLTPDPKQETWWQRLSDLQDLRDQTIHTKQDYSQTRYSKLLCQDIFETVEIYKVIINYYGKYILEKNKRLINDFPYNFGYDQVYPALMTDRTYKDIYNSLHNPFNPL